MYDYQPNPRMLRLPLEGCQVLLVEDNDDSREVATILLEAEGATVNAVACVKEALASLDGSIPDVLVSDIGMPDRDGYDLIRAIRLRTPELGLAGLEMKRSAFLNGADLLRHGVTIAQVVHSYGDVCQAVTELAVEKQEPITAEEFHVLVQAKRVDKLVEKHWHAELQIRRDRPRSALEGDFGKATGNDFVAVILQKFMQNQPVSPLMIDTSSAGSMGLQPVY